MYVVDHFEACKSQKSDNGEMEVQFHLRLTPSIASRYREAFDTQYTTTKNSQDLILGQEFTYPDWNAPKISILKIKKKTLTDKNTSSPSGTFVLSSAAVLLMSLLISIKSNAIALANISTLPFSVYSTELEKLYKILKLPYWKHYFLSFGCQFDLLFTDERF